jgi:hypothetical protein
MAFSITIDIKGQVDAKLKALQGVKPSSLGLVIGRQVTNLLRARFQELDKTRPNQLGGKRTHFYGDAARSTHYQVQPDGVVVGVSHVGIRQRVQGGTIYPQKAKALAIPAIAEAHGKRPREFNNLRLVILASGPALVEAETSEVGFTKKGKTKFRGSSGGRIFYFLRAKAVQQADPTILPDDQTIEATASKAASDYLSLLLERSKS